MPFPLRMNGRGRHALKCSLCRSWLRMWLGIQHHITEKASTIGEYGRMNSFACDVQCSLQAVFLC
jgi:hypothetical protein